MRAVDLGSPRRRVGVSQAIFVALFLGLTARVAYLCLDERGERRGDRQLLTAISVAPERGRIYDRDGEVLALSVPAPSLYALPDEIDDPSRTARALARALGVSAAPLRKRIEGAQAFVFLRRWIEEDKAKKIEALGLPGVGIVREPRRAYPLGPVAGAFLGFSNIDGEGVRGVERLEDGWLAGRRVRMAVERDARGNLLIGPGLDPGQSTGGDIAVTLDTAMQAHAEVALAEAVRRFKARAGFVITLDPASGDILALAEWPRFNPNRFRELPFHETRSRSFLDALEPGSTMKAFLAAGALDAGAVTRNEPLDLEGGVKVPGKWIRDRVARSSLDLTGILRVSSNAGAVRVAQRLGAAEHHAALLRFGFGRSTGSGFPEESTGLLRPWNRWRPIDHATVAFGQGISVTPIQLAAATAALAEDGRWRAPRLVRARRRAGDEEWTPVAGSSTREAVSPENAAITREMLVAVTEAGGTGRRAALEGVRVGGKTGTAQKFDAKAGRYSDHAMIAWFAGFAPADAPRLAIVVGIDEAQGEIHSGGEVAAPLFAEVAAAHLTHLGIPTRPRQSWSAERSRRASRPATPPPALAKTARQRTRPLAHAGPPPIVAATTGATPAQRAPAVAAGPPRRTKPGWIRVGERVFLPDLVGMGTEELNRLAAEVSLEVVVEGEGRVVAQDPPAGTILAAGENAVRVRCARRGNP